MRTMLIPALVLLIAACGDRRAEPRAIDARPAEATRVVPVWTCIDENCVEGDFYEKCKADGRNRPGSCSLQTGVFCYERAVDPTQFKEICWTTFERCDSNVDADDLEGIAARPCEARPRP